MPVITLPDNSKRRFSNPVTIMEVSQEISTNLAKETLAGKVDGELKDICELIQKDVTLTLITSKDKEGIGIIRHSWCTFSWTCY